MVIYSSDSGLILVVCSLLIECLLATLIWHQNLAVPRHLVGFPATFPATFPAPSQRPYERVRTDTSTPPSVYGARDGRIYSGGIIRQIRLRNRSNLTLLSALVNPSAAFSTDGTYFKITNPNSTCALWKYSTASICPDLTLINSL